MALIYVPCLNVDNPNEDTGLSVGATVVPTSGPEGGTSLNPGVTFSHPDVPFTLTISPFGPMLFIGINWQFWWDLFGLGETRIEREKEQIQDVYTPIFRFLHKAYGYPLRDGHALQFSSEYVEQMFREDDFKRRSAEGMYIEAAPLASSVFVDDTPSSGQRKRIVNQFLANAHINNWPANAWIYAWRGLVEAAPAACRKEGARWMKNPMLMETAAKYSVLLHYMPLANFSSAVTQHKFNDKSGRKLITHWMQNPQLVAGIPQVLEIPPWAVAYRSPQDGGGQSGNPYETQQIADREPIQRLWEKVQFQRPWYPDLIYIPDKGLPAPEVTLEPPPKPDDWDQQTPPQPWPGDNVLEIPPQPDGPIGWPQYPDCPPWNQRPQPDPDPTPQPDDDEPDQDQDDKCDPDCQQQIDYLIERVKFIDNWLVLGIIPRIENLEDWMRDLERRVPGPMPPLPNPNPYPPWLPAPPTDPGDDIDGDGIPDVDQPGPFSEDCIEYLKKLCDPETRCKEIAKCDRELECVDLTLCDEDGGPWGGMAECWLSKNTNNPPDVEGDRAGRIYPAFSVQSMLFAFTQGYGGSGQGQGGQSGGLPPVSAQSDQAEPWRIVSPYKQMILDAWDGSEWQTVADPFPLVDARPWIYADPAASEEPKARIITVKPRPGEIDPCTGVAEEILELPEVQP